MYSLHDIRSHNLILAANITGLVYYPFGMVTPGRSFAAGDGYRFGFNGKESDAETYGSGNIYNYGFRIYNPRLGKFLSVDPLTRSFPALTPFQYASNSPIGGVDLDGLEFMDKDQAMFEARNGLLMIKIENFSGPFQARQGLISRDPRMWNKGSIGASTILGQFNTKAIPLPNHTLAPPATYSIESGQMPFQPSPPFGFTNDDTKVTANLLVIEPPMTKQSNYTKPDQRYKTRYISGTTAGGGRTAATFTVALNLIYEAGYSYINKSIEEDAANLERQLPFAIQTLDMINREINTGDLIPPEYQTPQALSGIFNVILQGESNSSDPQIVIIGEMILEKNHMLKVPTEIGPIKYTGISGEGLDGFKGMATPTIKTKSNE